MNDVNWADIIFVMEKKHKNRLTAKFGQQLDGKKTPILEIPDEYQFMAPDLISHLEDTIMPFLDVEE